MSIKREKPSIEKLEFFKDIKDTYTISIRDIIIVNIVNDETENYLLLADGSWEEINKNTLNDIRIRLNDGSLLTYETARKLI